MMASTSLRQRKLAKSRYIRKKYIPTNDVPLLLLFSQLNREEIFVKKLPECLCFNFEKKIARMSSSSFSEQFARTSFCNFVEKLPECLTVCTIRIVHSKINYFKTTDKFVIGLVVMCR